MPNRQRSALKLKCEGCDARNSYVKVYRITGAKEGQFSKVQLCVLCLKAWNQLKSLEVRRKEEAIRDGK